MRVLVLTNHFSQFCGSEVVALQTAQWFAERGDAVTLAANSIGDPIRRCAAGLALTTHVDKIELGDFDLVWCQHDLLSQLPLAAYERAAQGMLPHIAMVSLSPYEPYEHVDGLLTLALSAEVYANSPESAAELLRRNGGAIAPSSVQVFHNAAPAAFWRAGHDASPGPLRRVVVVSNHPPPELMAALSALQDEGVQSRVIGLHNEVKLVEPFDIAEADAVISIGKSVVYAIAQRRPVYIYDHFGGDGWLTRANFEANLFHNFSGRPQQRRLTPEALAAELKDGYAAAASEARMLGERGDLWRLRLGAHLSELSRRAQDRLAWRSEILSLWLNLAQFRAHLAASHQKSAVMRRAYLSPAPGS